MIAKTNKTVISELKQILKFFILVCVVLQIFDTIVAQSHQAFYSTFLAHVRLSKQITDVDVTNLHFL